MPLNRPALSLGAGPRGVQDARRWVVDTFEDIGRRDLSESAEMAVSELVTNALLHGQPPIQVRVSGTLEHPRVEVRDGSVDPPELPVTTAEDDLDGLLLTFGRGLSIVARAADAWGAEIEHDGKVVWFTPAAQLSEDLGTDGLITGLGADPTAELPSDPAEFRLGGVPVTSYVAFQRHFHELRREVRLLALAHESDYPLAKDLTSVFDDLGRPLMHGSGAEEVHAAQEHGRPTADLTVTMSRGAAARLDRLAELLDVTDEFCREERMLSLARSPEQRAFQNWFLGEFVRQANDEAPLPWPGNGPHRHRQRHRRRGRERRPPAHQRLVRVSTRLCLAVAAGGAVGASLRYLLGEAVPDHDGFPWTTFAINVVGSFLLAALPAVDRVRRSPALDGRSRPGAARRLHHAVGVRRAGPCPAGRRPGRSGRGVPGRDVRRLRARRRAGHRVVHADRARPRGDRGRRRMTLLLVALGAAVGAPLRFCIASWLDAEVPWGTFTVNVVGSLLLGFLSALALGGHTAALLGTGFCGGLTTYSAFAVQSARLGRRGLAYAVLTILVSLGAAALGFAVGA